MEPPLGPRTSCPLRAGRPAQPDVEGTPERFQMEQSSRFSIGINLAERACRPAADRMSADPVGTAGDSSSTLLP
jgi:hypothetical protein